MGITTQHCIKGVSVLTIATESKSNGIAQPAGCDDRGPGGPGIPVGTDDGVGSCANGLTEIQDDVDLFFKFMTFLAPAPRLPIDPFVNLQGGTAFSNAGCAGCHLLKDYMTPSSPANGVPGNRAGGPDILSITVSMFRLNWSRTLDLRHVARWCSVGQPAATARASADPFDHHVVCSFT
jgi:hypothetical protein